MTNAGELPADLRKRIAPARKRTNNLGKVDDENDKRVVSTTRDRLWLLSTSEVYGRFDSDYTSYAAIYNAEGEQYKLYSDKKVTTGKYSFCKKDGADSLWWLRSLCIGSSDCFRRIGDNGDWYDYNAYGASGVSPGFCF